MKDLSLAFALYNQTIANGFKQLRSDLSALNDAADNLVMRLAADDGAIAPDTTPIEDNAHCFECGDDVMDMGMPRRCKDC